MLKSMKMYLCGLVGALLCGFISVPAAHAAVVSGSIDTTSEVDYIYFSVASLDTVSINVLAQDVLSNLDPHIHLFSDDGSLDVGDLITSNDDSSDIAGLVDGSTSEYDSYISTTLAASDYVVAIGSAILTSADAVAGTNTTGGNWTGAYQITITGGGAQVVPLPAALPLLLSALGFFGFFGWRRKRMAAA